MQLAQLSNVETVLMPTALNSIGEIIELREVERCRCGRIVGEHDRRSGRELHGEPMEYCVHCGEACVFFECVDVCELCDRNPVECDCCE